MSTAFPRLCGPVGPDVACRAVTKFGRQCDQPRTGRGDRPHLCNLHGSMARKGKRVRCVEA